MKRVLRWVLLGAFALALVVPITPAAAAPGPIPTQWIAKTYTEALGRAPTQTEWQAGIGAFTSVPCDATSLRAFARPIYTGEEYAGPSPVAVKKLKKRMAPPSPGLGYDNPSRVLTLVRGVLNREPDEATFNLYADQLDNGTPWSDVVDEAFASDEFRTNVAPKACGPNPTYGFGTLPAMSIPPSGTGFAGGTGDQLQALLDATPPGGTVFLAQKALVRVQLTLRIPAGVTLATAGTPGRRAYAKLGRLVRASQFPGEVVTVNPGGSLDSVWVDGQRGVPLRVAAGPVGTPSDQTLAGAGLGQGESLLTANNTPGITNTINVSLIGGIVTNSVLSNSSGWTAMQLGTSDGTVCTATVANNLFTSYTSRHIGLFTDGISNYCDHATIEHNEIVDPTDVGIVSFGTNSLGPQASQVRFNTVLAAGNNAYGALVADGTLNNKTAPPDFTGLVFHDNVIWTGPRTHFDIGMSVGTRAWFGTNSATGFGAAFRNNHTGTLTARVGSGIAVAGMLDVDVTGNSLNVEITSDATPCPHVPVGASVSDGYASGTIQPYADVLYESCVAHPAEQGAPGIPGDDDQSAAFGPGPELLYVPPPAAPQLTNTGVWQATPILVSGATAYRGGEFLYQDFLYDDLGAGGTYTYPTDARYAGNAADFVELRLKSLTDATAIRITYNSMIDPTLSSTTVALGTSDVPRAFPFGANASAPAEVFVTVHGASAVATDAATGAVLAGATASVDLARRQVDVRVPYSILDPRSETGLRVAAATGLWDADNDSYSTPLPGSTAFFNVAFRTTEPLGGTRTADQSSALTDADLSSLFATVDFTKLAAGINDDSGVPRAGTFNRIYASRYETQQGRGNATSLHTADCADGCAPALAGQLQGYSIYVPSKPLPGAGYGLTALLHASGGNANSYQTGQNQQQLGERANGSIVFTPEARGPSYFYYGQAAADTFETWADIARTYPIDSSDVAIVGTSMGGYGTYKLAAMYPDLFAAAVPVTPCPSAGTSYVPLTPAPGGDASLILNVADSLRHVPSLSMQSANDQLCTYPGPGGSRSIFERFDVVNYPFDARTFVGAEHAVVGGLILDGAQPVADFLASRRVVADPPHVTYVLNEEMSQPENGLTADHAYWVSGLRLGSTSTTIPVGTIDVYSHGFGTADPAEATLESTNGFWPSTPWFYAADAQWPAPGEPAPVLDRLDITATNISKVTIDPVRANVTCGAELNVVSDGPLTVTLLGCP